MGSCEYNLSATNCIIDGTCYEYGDGDVCNVHNLKINISYIYSSNVSQIFLKQIGLPLVLEIRTLKLLLMIVEVLLSST